MYLTNYDSRDYKASLRRSVDLSENGFQYYEEGHDVVNAQVALLRSFFNLLEVKDEKSSNESIFLEENLIREISSFKSMAIEYNQFLVKSNETGEIVGDKPCSFGDLVKKADVIKSLIDKV